MSIIAPSPSGRNGPRGMREIECEHYNYISLRDQRELMGKKTAHTKPIAELKIFNSTRTMELVMKRVGGPPGKRNVFVSHHPNQCRREAILARHQSAQI